MSMTRVAGALLAATLTIGLTACTSASHSTSTHARTTAVKNAASDPPTETLTPLLAQALPNVKGKSFTSATVDFPPGAQAVPHRHGQAFVFAYVLQGSFRSHVEGEPVKTYHVGDAWTENPGAHHVLTENTSATKPAKLLVVFVADPGAELKVDDAPH